ncbi:MAG TPA: PAS domain S-box protein [Bacteroidota bacterium]|nr:PAS domain S-box protein [Bacteroidota bacterium]
MNFIRNIKKFRATLGPVEQAQIVASTAVVVAMVTIVLVRVFSGYKLGWYDFLSVITVGIFGFLIVYFTLNYGRLLEEQKQEVIALNAIAEAVNRALEISYLLQNALLEVQRVLPAEYGWIYLVEGEKLVLKSSRGIEGLPAPILPSGSSISDASLAWIQAPRVVRIPQAGGEKQIGGPADIRVWESVPIMMKDTFSGLIIVASRNRTALTEKQLELIAAFANQIGVALENATLFERLRRSEERYMDLFENSPDMYHLVNRVGTIVSCNRTEADLLGYRKEDLVGHSILKLYPLDYHDQAKRLLEQIFEQGRGVQGLEEQMVDSKGELLDVSLNTSIIYDDQGQPILMRAVARDITEKKKLEAKILHAQRIDSIGNLAGGISHDFNNILTSILGSTAIMKRKMKKTEQWYRFADIIETAAKRGAALTRQLLTFARKGSIQFKPVVINDIVDETLHLFERSIDKTITVRKDLSDEIYLISGDDGQIQQAILNLLINARDAMPDGGSITITTERIDVDTKLTNAIGEQRSGEFVAVGIRDEGVGMDRTVQQRIFEPFFTTKDQGKGTGLGLSVVYGVVNSHNGFITVQSEPRKGSEFILCFPLLGEGAGRQRGGKKKPLARGKETVLVIDDEEHVGEVIKGMLEYLGYDVTVVQSGQQALSVYEEGRRFVVIVLDMNMPEMGGQETFYRIKNIDPDVCVIVSTGYSNTSIDGTPFKEAIDGFLQKPYQLEELSKTMREVLGRGKPH